MKGLFFQERRKNCLGNFHTVQKDVSFLLSALHLVEIKYNLVLSMKYVTIEKIQIPDLRALQELLQKYPAMCGRFSITLIKKIYRRILSIWK